MASIPTYFAQLFNFRDLHQSTRTGRIAVRLLVSYRFFASTVGVIPAFRIPEED